MEINKSSQNKSGIKDYLIKQFYLIKSELLTLRLSWKWSLLIVLVSPISVLIFLYLLVGMKNPEYMNYVISGNIIMSLVTGTMLTLGQELGVLKQIRGFDYYASLPIKKIQLITAYLIRATIVTLPSIMVLIFLGRIIFDVQININFTMFLIIFLSGLSLSGLGAFIGVYSTNMEQSSTVTQIIQPLIVYCAPVFRPFESMPKIMQYISYLVPTTYVSNALRKSFVGEFDLISILVLLLFSIVSVYLVEYKIDWRQKS